jgi:hypothetical protein
MALAPIACYVRRVLTAIRCLATLVLLLPACRGSGRGWESLPRVDQELWIACESIILRSQCGPDPTARTIDRGRCEEVMTKRFLVLDSSEERRRFLVQLGCRAAEPSPSLKRPEPQPGPSSRPPASRP